MGAWVVINAGWYKVRRSSPRSPKMSERVNEAARQAPPSLLTVDARTLGGFVLRPRAKPEDDTATGNDSGSNCNALKCGVGKQP